MSLKTKKKGMIGVACMKGKKCNHKLLRRIIGLSYFRRHFSSEPLDANENIREKHIQEEVVCALQCADGGVLVCC